MSEYTKFAAGTVPSVKHPTRNEDSYFALRNHPIFGVFDGLGGHAAGEVASSAARDFVAGEMKKHRTLSWIGRETEFLRQVLSRASEHVYHLASQNLAYRDMGTTASILWFVEDRDSLWGIVGNVGDSRVYRLPKQSGKLEQITLDDGVIEGAYKDDLRHARELQKVFNNVKNEADLDKVDASARWMFYRRNIIGQMIGQEAAALAPRTHRIPVASGDALLVCTDGVHDNLTDSEIEAILLSNTSVGSVFDKLLAAAKQRSEEGSFRSKKDDMTAIVVRVK